MTHYTNPAFCQKSEFYPREISFTSTQNNNCSIPGRDEFSRSNPTSSWTAQSIQFELQTHQNKQHPAIRPNRQTPKHGSKPIYFNSNTESYFEKKPTKSQSSKPNVNGNGYALVPLDELPSTRKDRYAILPANNAFMMHNSSMRLTKSQDHLDYDTTEFANEDEDEDDDNFTSLPVFNSHEDDGKLVSAFSTDFINKSIVLIDQNNMQRYTVVPTDDDEEVVDSNHEIIEMYQGRVHRYAVIPTDDEDCHTNNEFRVDSNALHINQMLNKVGKGDHSIKLKTPSNNKPLLRNTTLKSGDIQPIQNYETQNPKAQASMHYDEPPKRIPETPTKNPVATQKLHELLSSPRKCEPETLQRHGSYHTIMQRSPNRIQLQSSFQKPSEFTPQKLYYESKRTMSQNIDHRTTAIISPRLQQQMLFNETTLCSEKSWPHESLQKVENATATIGIISLMLILTGIINSGLCLYMVTDVSMND